MRPVLPDVDQKFEREDGIFVQSASGSVRQVRFRYHSTSSRTVATVSKSWLVGLGLVLTVYTLSNSFANQNENRINRNAVVRRWSISRSR